MTHPKIRLSILCQPIENLSVKYDGTHLTEIHYDVKFAFLDKMAQKADDEFKLELLKECSVFQLVLGLSQLNNFDGNSFLIKIKYQFVKRCLKLLSNRLQVSLFSKLVIMFLEYFPERSFTN